MKQQADWNKSPGAEAVWLALQQLHSHTARPSDSHSPTIPSILWHQNNTQLPATIITVISPLGALLGGWGGELHTFWPRVFPADPESGYPPQCAGEGGASSCYEH